MAEYRLDTAEFQAQLSQAASKLPCDVAGSKLPTMSPATNRLAPELEGADIYEATWHPDCNENGEDDVQEIEKGSVSDINGNDIPDECESESPDK